MSGPTYPKTPHKRRTPCCEIEAYRYLDTHGFLNPDLDSAVGVALGDEPRTDTRPPFCGASFDGFTCNRGAGHEGDHKDMNGTGGLVGWRAVTTDDTRPLSAAWKRAAKLWKSMYRMETQRNDRRMEAYRLAGVGMMVGPMPNGDERVTITVPGQEKRAAIKAEAYQQGVDDERARHAALVAAARFRASVTFTNLDPQPEGPDLLEAIAAYMDRQDDMAELIDQRPKDRQVQADVRRWASALRAALEDE